MKIIITNNNNNNNNNDSDSNDISCCVFFSTSSSLFSANPLHPHSSAHPRPLGPPFYSSRPLIRLTGE